MKKILLIEDNLEMRENTAEILELAGYEVTAAENGKVGVALAKDVSPDLIICDIMMPELDGYGVLYLLSKDSDTAGIPFIFLTAKAEKSDFRKGMNMGADDYVTKPFDEMELLQAIESRFQRSEKFKTEFNSTTDDLEAFINDAKALEELQQLSADRKLRKFRKKDDIYYEDDYPTGMYFIAKGKVKTAKMNNDTKEMVTGLHKTGDFIGYMPLIQNTNYSETATALEDSELYKIPRQDFIDLLHRNRDVAHKFIRILSQDLMDKEQQLLNLAYNSVRKRVADGLTLLVKRYKENQEGDFSMAISRDDLASIVGTATETVIRTLSEFKEEGLIKVKGSTITVLNEEGLANLRF